MKIITASEIFGNLPADLRACVMHDMNRHYKVRLLAVGDTAFSKRIRDVGETHGYNHMLQEVSGFIQNADIAFCNFESPIEDRIDIPFASSPNAAAEMAGIGFTVAQLANSHAADLGPNGLAKTISTFQALGIAVLGVGDSSAHVRRLVRTDCNGVKIGWLACTRNMASQNHQGPYYWEFNEEELIKTVGDAKAAVDVLIVSIHTGYCYVEVPGPDEKRIARRLAQAGAKLVLMHHAHVLQGAEFIEACLVCYNLGNFLFDWRDGYIVIDKWLELQTTGAIYIVDLDSQGICRLTLLPIYFGEDCCLHWARAEIGRSILSRFMDLSSLLSSENWLNEFNRQRLERNYSEILSLLLYHLRKMNLQILVSELKRVRLRQCMILGKWILQKVRNVWFNNGEGK